MIETSFKFCPECGEELEGSPRFCPSCGAELRGGGGGRVGGAGVVQVTVGTKSPGLAAVLSFLISGLGQIYVGRIGRGIAILLGGIVIAAISFFLLFIPMIIYWIWNIYDAYKLAKQYNEVVLSTGKPPW